MTDATHFTYTVSGTPATPATGSRSSRTGTRTWTVEDLPGAPAMAVFAEGDARGDALVLAAGGGLTIGDVGGVVLRLFRHRRVVGLRRTRNPAARARRARSPRGTVIAAKSLALDYGVSGNGYIESTTIDGTGTGRQPDACQHDRHGHHLGRARLQDR
jgi:hypothetical protein